MSTKTRWGPADWKRLPVWAVELESQRWIDSRRVTRAVYPAGQEPPWMWWVSHPWRRFDDPDTRS